jgi:predicted dehydrogenase
MLIRAAILGAAHVHAPSFARCVAASDQAEIAGVWDHDAERGAAFAAAFGAEFEPDLGALLARSDAAVIASENMRHAGLLEAAVPLGLHVLCEKPIAPSREHEARISVLSPAPGQVLATAFPCPFSPSYQAMAARLASGELGKILAVSATNRGTCPGGWFTEAELSGGGAMIDHVVHAADLMRRLTGGPLRAASASIGNRMYEQAWEDTAHVMVELNGGAFGTIDSSWSRPSGWRTWGDLTLKATCELGVVEADLFGQGPLLTLAGRHSLEGVGADLDRLMIEDFLDSIREGRDPMSTLADGLAASRVALEAYESLPNRP